jgi:hypothetical protein
MRILLILIILVAAFVVVQAHRHGCKYDASLVGCVLHRPAAEKPAAEAPAAPEAPAPEAPAGGAPAPAQQQ